jgi:hypothetical protein
MDRKITAIFGFDLANVIWQPFCFGVKSSVFFIGALPAGEQMLSRNVGRRDSYPSPFCFFSPSQTDDILLLFSQIFQHLAHLNG